MATKEVKKRGVKSLKGLYTVTEGLKMLYRQKLLPLEKYYAFSKFHSPSLEDTDFDNKPMILVVGQYSTGKTTFIRYLLEQGDYPGGRIGPEPTTDCFTTIMHGDVQHIIPGNALVVDPNKPFRKLSPFGNTFLNRFQCVHFPNQVLESISIIDTPGILSSSKRKMSRGKTHYTRPPPLTLFLGFSKDVNADKLMKAHIGYDFPAVVRWFADHVDRIVLLCDAHKLELSDEFSRTVAALRGNEDKLRVVLNKADSVQPQQLMRVYGALMWSLGKAFRTPEVLRVYIGSFWSAPLRAVDNRRLFESEEEDLFADIQNLPRNSALRKLNDLVKRARLVRAHAYIISTLKEEMPLVFRRDHKKRDLIYDLPQLFSSLQQKHQLSPGDFPDCAKMQEQLMNHDFTKFKALKPKLLVALDEFLTTDIAKLMPLLRQEELEAADQPGVQGGALLDDSWGPFAELNPFCHAEPGGLYEEPSSESWVVSRDKPKYDEIFYSLSPDQGKLSGTKVKDWMLHTRLPSSVLGRIWRLSDVDCDGMLDEEEFALANHLIEVKLDGFGLPKVLPVHLVPPSKRRCRTSNAENKDD